MNPNLSDWDDDLPPESDEAYQDFHLFEWLNTKR